jgi:hypothetical protein
MKKIILVIICAYVTGLFSSGSKFSAFTRLNDTLTSRALQGVKVPIGSLYNAPKFQKTATQTHQKSMSYDEGLDINDMPKKVAPAQSQSSHTNDYVSSHDSAFTSPFSSQVSSPRTSRRGSFSTSNSFKVQEDPVVVKEENLPLVEDDDVFYDAPSYRLPLDHIEEKLHKKAITDQQCLEYIRDCKDTLRLAKKPEILQQAHNLLNKLEKQQTKNAFAYPIEFKKDPECLFLHPDYKSISSLNLSNQSMSSIVTTLKTDKQCTRNQYEMYMQEVVDVMREKKSSLQDKEDAYRLLGALHDIGLNIQHTYKNNTLLTSYNEVVNSNHAVINSCKKDLGIKSSSDVSAVQSSAERLSNWLFGK